MPDELQSLFDAMAALGHVPQLERARGSVRFDLAEAPPERWLLTVDQGDVKVSRRGGKADCVVRADRATLLGLFTGRINAMAAVLRGTVVVEGDPHLLLLLQRLFPGPAKTTTSKGAS